VTSPVGGESWAGGSVHDITWTATDNAAVTAVDLALSTDGGASFPTAIATGIANSGTFAWTLPGLVSTQARVRVRARDAAGNVGSDSSHTNFSITGWTITASAGANGSIAPSGTIGVADGATPSFTISPNAGCQVQDVLVNGSSVGAVTNFAFPAVHANQTISATFVDAQAPTAAVTAPNGAEQTYVGGHMNLTWTATDNLAVTTVDLDVSRAGAGGPFESIAAGIANTGTFDWLVSGPATQDAFVRVTAHDAATNSGQDLSDAAFEIFPTAGVLDGPITEFGLAPVWPNPVRGSTRFTIAMPRDAKVRLSVHDVQGREQLVLADGVLSAGRHSIDWSSGGGARLGPGLYFVRFTVPGHSYVRRFALVW
jgi:hypothetical protein